MLKYFLNISDGITFAIKYDEMKKIFFFGGYKIYSLELRMILEEYFEIDFEVEEINFVYPQRNKVKFTFENFSNNRFYAALKKLKAHDFVLTPTRSLEKVMR